MLKQYIKNIWIVVFNNLNDFLFKCHKHLKGIKNFSVNHCQ